MMRLPRFRFVAPTSVAEAADVLASAATGDAMVIAGGTDLIPNMKRRQQTPGTLVGLRRIEELRRIRNGSGLQVGAGVTLSDLLEQLRRSPSPSWTALGQAVGQIATPHLRNMGTLGGNLCLDTRCNYYDQNYEWRKAIGFCMKKDGDICWVATSSPKCLAVSSSDTAPALTALGATVTLVSAAGQRTLPIGALYHNDGIDYLARQRAEILTAIQVPQLDGWKSTYWKLRRRGAFDFPVLGVAAAVRFDGDGIVTDARIVLGAVASRPVEATAAAAMLVGGRLTTEQIVAAAEAAAQPAKPMDNTDFNLTWRKRVTKAFVSYALQEIRGDDMRATRMRIARQLL